ncbi:MAG: radical SAM protein [Ruminococcaceae bacterium]|nr:radical SAM protein [Oscillospiraceae bacterium]
MKILLLYPPQWTPNSPYLALPLLSAQLKKHGYETEIKDINIEFFNHILTKDNLARRLCEARELFRTLGEEVTKNYPDAVEKFSSYSVKEQTMLLKFKRIAEILGGTPSPDETVEKAEEAVSVLKSKDKFYDPEALFAAKRTVQEALKIASLPFAPNEIIYDNYFGNPLLKMDWVNIDSQCKDKSVNMFIEYFEEEAKKIAANSCGLICISVPDLSQLIPALTLSRLIKQVADKPVAIGGNYITQNKADFMNHPEIFGEYCDYLMVGDGERSIIEAAEYAEGKRDITDVSNLVYLSGNEVICNPPADELNFREVAYADFDSLDFSLYFSPETVIPMQLSKGCYWGKCTFCDYYYGQQCYDTKKIPDVIDEIKHFMNKYGVKHFLFIDEAIPPKYYNKLADAILENNLEIYFYSFVRLEKGFTREVLDNLYKAGFRIGLWGYEAWSERIMKMMNKGIDLSERIRILRDSREAGIWNNGLFIMGYPTETREEIEKTISVVYEHRDIINSCTPSNFSLKKNAILMNFIGQNGLLGFETNGEFYTVLKDKIDGIPQSERREIRRQFHADYIEANKHCLWPINYSDTDHILLYLSKYTCDYVSGYRSEGNICLQFR